MKNKLSGRFWLALTVFSLMGQIAWVVENMYFNVFIYKMFNASASDIANMVAASAVAATLTTVFIGALSDKIGKRKLFICSGYILWGISIFCFVLLREDFLAAIVPATVSAASVGVSLTIILDCLMTFFGSSANDAAFNAWLTDSTDASNRGSAEGINSMMPLVAILAVFGGFMFFDLSLESSWTLIFSIIGALVLAVGVLGLFIIKEPQIKPVKEPYLKGIIYGFMPSTVRANPVLYVSLAAFIVFNISIQIFMPYLILYYEVSLGMADYVLIMAPAIIIASAVTALWGKVYDKKGFGFSGVISLASLALGYVLLFLLRDTASVFIGSLFMMSGYLASMAVFGAKIRDNTPAGKSGMLQGVRIFSQVFVPGIVGPYIGRLVLANAETVVNSDGTESFIPNANIFLAALIALVLLIPLFLFASKEGKPRTVELKTEFEKGLDENETPFSDYPRPQMRRDSYLCLNGRWDFALEGKAGRQELGKILVPFVPESRISGIGREIPDASVMIYSRSFEIPEGFKKDRVILHFGAVDQRCEVYVNESKVGENEGGYLPFSFDITEHLKDGENTLCVRASDPLDLELPYGKQSKRRGGMWYTKTSGIWQTVWLESIPQSFIESLEITPTLDSVNIKVIGGEAQKTLILHLENDDKEYVFEGDGIDIKIDGARNWCPEDPYLYGFEVISGQDMVESYFALRTIEIKDCGGKKQICLNGKPYYFHGLLDQGYFSDGIFLPASPRGFENDILKMKECGFNMLRKHIKLEPELFYYYCDRHGMIVFQDMINSGRYSFFYDTALPTVGLKRLPSRHASKRRRETFMKTSAGMIKQLYNHPCVCYYTIFNEGWGQFDADGCYTALKALDGSRIFDATSGWFFAKKSDVVSEHIYFKPVKLKDNYEMPTVLSEFGGYSCKIEGHSFNLDKTYGYRFFTDAGEFENSLIALYENEVAPCFDLGLNATILTQVSDVEDETNGLLTYDRAVLKVDPEKMKTLYEKLKLQYEKAN